MIFLSISLYFWVYFLVILTHIIYSRKWMSSQRYTKKSQALCLQVALSTSNDTHTHTHITHSSLCKDGWWHLKIFIILHKLYFRSIVISIILLQYIAIALRATFILIFFLESHTQHTHIYALIHWRNWCDMIFCFYSGIWFLFLISTLYHFRFFFSYRFVAITDTITLNNDWCV